VLFLGPPGREPTEREQARRIRDYLGLAIFDQDTAEWLRQGAAEGRSAAELLAQAEDALRRWQIVLPAPGTLERIVNSSVAQATGDLFETIAARLPDKLREAIDLLLEVPPGDARSSLFRLKDYPRAPNAGVIKADINRWRLIRDLLGAQTGLDDLDPRIVRQAGELGRRYNAGDLRRFAPAKRYTLVACYLFEARKTLLDHVVEMNDLFLTALARRSRNAVEKQRKLLRRQACDGLRRVLGTVDALIEADGAQTVAAFREAVEAPRLAQAAAACRAYERLEQRGELDAILSRYGTLRQYLPSFFEWPFQAAPGSEPLLRAIEAGARGSLTLEDPSDFVPAGWRPYLAENGAIDRRIWEMALAFATRSALRAGGLFLSESREHVSFWNLIYDSRNWREHRSHAYRQLDLPASPHDFLNRLVADFERAARAAAEGLSRNPFASVRDGRLKRKRRDALPISRELRRLRDTFRASFPRVRIEDVLQDVDEWCGFTRAFQPLGGYMASHTRDPYRALLATLLAHGTNLGLAVMSQSVDDLAAEMLQDTADGFCAMKPSRRPTPSSSITTIICRSAASGETAAARRPTGSASRSSATACSAASILAISAITTARSPFIPTPPISTPLRYAGHCLHTARSGLRARRHPRKRHRPADPRAYLRSARLHRAPLRPVRLARDSIHAAAEGPSRPGAERDRSRGRLRRLAAVVPQHRQPRPDR
jgi:hypothetical protein